MTSWKKTITTPFWKAHTFFNTPQQQQHFPIDNRSRSETESQGIRITDLNGELMACTYEDVRVMWSILNRSKASATPCDFSS